MNKKDRLEYIKSKYSEVVDKSNSVDLVKQLTKTILSQVELLEKLIIEQDNA